MKKHILAMLLGASLLALNVTPLWAEDVLVTKAGKKYHYIDSSYAQREGVERISLEEAEKRGLLPGKDYLKHKALEAEKQTKK